MKKKNTVNSDEITKLYTDTYRSRMPLYNDYVFHRIYGSDTEESRAALIGLLHDQERLRAVAEHALSNRNQKSDRFR